MSKKIIDKTELDNLINTRFILYGAGTVAHTVISYILKKRRIDNIFCIAVSNLENNPSEILGVPVCLIADVKDIKISYPIVIATMENQHNSIMKELANINNKIYRIGNSCYAEIKRKNPDIQIEIWNGIRSLELMFSEISKNTIYIRNELMRVKECLVYGVGCYDELLEESQYEQRLKEWYYDVTGETLNLKNPVTFNEKIQWIKLYGNIPLMTQLTDKYLVRNWVKDKIGEKYLTKLLGVYNTYDQINIKQLPNKFVLKCNHACGFNYIVKDKNKFNNREAKNKFDRWMNINWAFIGGLELQYKNIVPKIIAEEYMENDNEDLFDYKFWCFNGKCKFIMFLSERKKGLKMNNFDRNWNLLPFTYDYPQNKIKIEKPNNLEEMIEIAEKLAQGFAHVRVDLYRLNNGDIKFGEMTFTSANGIMNWSDSKVNRKLGDMIDLHEVL